MNVLVAARPYDLSDASADAFVERHLAMVHLLAHHHRVSVVGLRVATDEASFSSQLADHVRGEVEVPGSAPGRLGRLRRAGRRMRGEPVAEWERSLATLAATADPDVVVTIGPWLDVEYRALFAAHPSLHLFEEDLTVMPELAAQSRRAEVLRAIEDHSRRRVGMNPTAVVVISAAEMGAARRRFPNSSLAYLPYTLDERAWPLATSMSGGDHVLVVGNLAQGRNSEGLVAVLDAIRARRGAVDIRVRLVSGTGLERSVLPYTAESWVDVAGPVSDPYAEYRSAGVALVPATRVTGFKTTVLQAWTAGCPVVCFPASARTLGPGGETAVLVGSTADDVVDHLVELRKDPQGRARLASTGIELARNGYSPTEAGRRLLRLVEQVAETQIQP